MDFRNAQNNFKLNEMASNSIENEEKCQLANGLKFLSYYQMVFILRESS